MTNPILEAIGRHANTEMAQKLEHGIPPDLECNAVAKEIFNELLSILGYEYIDNVD